MTTTTPADRLDEIFAEVKPLQEKISKLMFTPAGRLRDYGPDTQAEIDALDAIVQPLTREACRIIRDVTA